mgnify:FL=1
MGCSLGQGFLYAAPVPAVVIGELLQRFGQQEAAPGRRRDRHVANAA